MTQHCCGEILQVPGNMDLQQLAVDSLYVEKECMSVY